MIKIKPIKSITSNKPASYAKEAFVVKERSVKVINTQEPKFDLTGNKSKEIIKEFKLTLQQERFCKLYATDRDFFGNGALSYAEAYNLDRSKKGWYNRAKGGAYENLTKPHLVKRVNEYLELEGFTDENVDRQHLFLINQDADLKTKMAAIKEYNALKKRVDGAMVKISVEDLMTDNLKKRKEELAELGENQ